MHIQVGDIIISTINAMAQYYGECEVVEIRDGNCITKSSKEPDLHFRPAFGIKFVRKIVKDKFGETGEE